MIFESCSVGSLRNARCNSAVIFASMIFTAVLTAQSPNSVKDHAKYGIGFEPSSHVRLANARSQHHGNLLQQSVRLLAFHALAVDEHQHQMLARPL